MRPKQEKEKHSNTISGGSSLLNPSFKWANPITSIVTNQLLRGMVLQVEESKG